MIRNKKGVFLDLYGTLLIYGDMKSAWADWADAFFSRLRLLGLPLSHDAFLNECVGFFGKEQLPDENGGRTPLEIRIRNLCVRLGLDVKHEDVSNIANHILSAWEQHMTVDPEAHRVLRMLAGHKCLALVSNFDHPPHVKRTLSAHGLLSLFKSTVISGNVGLSKPNPAIFGVALRETGLRPSDVVYVGDTSDDVDGARAAGIFPVLIRRPQNPTKRDAFDFSHGEQSSPNGNEEALDPTIDKSVTRITSLDSLPGLLL